MRRIGVFCCWCGSNIGGVIDVPRLAMEALNLPAVAFSTDYKYMCSEPGQELMVRAVAEHRLDGVVVAACSPRIHEATFRQTLERAGLNPYLLVMANVREHCTWVHPDDPERAFAKALALVRGAAAKAARTEPLAAGTLPVTKRALVIGGGIAGIQAALDVADAGFEVLLVEREPTIGGKMVLLDKTFPTLDCSACISTPKMVAVAQHPRIRLFTYAEVVGLKGFVGNFEVTVRQKARSVDHAKCTGCGACWAKCPSRVPDEYNAGLGRRKAIYVPFPQAVPNKPVIDRRHCRQFTRGRCGVCQKACPAGAIDYAEQDREWRERVGAVVVATGFDLFPWAEAYGEYGYGRHPDVITGRQFERLANAAGPTGGKIVRPSDGAVPRSVVFVQCVGSRDEAKGREYCSRVCCMYTAKHAWQVLEKVPEAEVFVFYIDVRTAGKAYEEFYVRARRAGAQYIRGRVARIYPEGNRLRVVGTDTLLGRPVEVAADLVVLATGLVPAAGSAELARVLGCGLDKDGFFQEAHPKLRPVESATAGIFLAGTCQGPKDIPDTVAQASAAAAKVVGLLARDEMAYEPTVAVVDEGRCTGCGKCRAVCPFKAVELVARQVRTGTGTAERVVAEVNPGLCAGCGNCTVACPSGVIDLKGFTNEQLLAEVDALCL
ncbi:MAG: CoB--CoM heterodisulfide reductase iron-sulfur subunit A family protein [Firmicutes bacterium]|nr:CoB--CoM heterodisulfide reductase iron-sulfur subunit A family protein [Bacillota bacterium]